MTHGQVVGARHAHRDTARRLNPHPSIFSLGLGSDGCLNGSEIGTGGLCMSLVLCEVWVPCVFCFFKTFDSVKSQQCQ